MKAEKSESKFPRICGQTSLAKEGNNGMELESACKEFEPDMYAPPGPGQRQKPALRGTSECLMVPQTSLDL